MDLTYFANIIARQQTAYDNGQPVGFSKTAIQKAIDFANVMHTVGTEDQSTWADKLLKHMVKGNPWAAGACLKHLQAGA